MTSRRVLAACAVAAAFGAPRLAAAQLQLIGAIPSTGGGLGAQATVLTLQSPGNSTTEQGCITPAGFTCATYTNANVQQGQTQLVNLGTVSGGLTGETFRLVLNLAEPNTANSALLNSAQVRLYASTGQEVFLASIGSTPIPYTLNGIGSSGYQFSLGSTSQQQFDAAVQQYGLANLRLGVGAQLSNVTGGPESFAVTRGIATQAVVPEPATVALLGGGLLGLAGLARRRRA